MPQTYQADILLDDGELCRAAIHDLGRSCRTVVRWPRAPGHYLVAVAITSAELAIASGAEPPQPVPTMAGYLAIGDMEHPWTLCAGGRQARLLSIRFSRTAYAALCAPGCGVARLASVPDDPGRCDPLMLQLALGLASMSPWAPSRDGSDPSARVLRAMLLHLGQCYGHVENPRRAASGGLSPWQFRRATDYIAGHLDQRLRLAEVAATCALSPNYFGRLFKQTTGITPHQWLLEQRVASAKQLLMATATPLAEIAMATGFADQTHFTRVFSRLAGRSPMAWRRAIACGEGAPQTRRRPSAQRRRIDQGKALA